MNLLLRNGLALAAAFIAGAGCAELLPRSPIQQQASLPAPIAAPTIGTLRLGLDDDRSRVLIELPSQSPPMSLAYDAAHMEKLIDQLGTLRSYLAPPRPNAPLLDGDNLIVLPDSGWYVGRDKQSDKAVLAIMDARFGWIATEMDRARAEKLVAALRQYLPGLGI